MQCCNSEHMEKGALGKMRCDCCGTYIQPIFDGKAVMQITVQIAEREYILCAACMNVIKWADKIGGGRHEHHHH